MRSRTGHRSPHCAVLQPVSNSLAYSKFNRLHTHIYIPCMNSYTCSGIVYAAPYTAYSTDSPRSFGGDALSLDPALFILYAVSKRAVCIALINTDGAVCQFVVQSRNSPGSHPIPLFPSIREFLAYRVPESSKGSFEQLNESTVVAAADTRPRCANRGAGGGTRTVAVELRTGGSSSLAVPASSQHTALTPRETHEEVRRRGSALVLGQVCSCTFYT